MNASSGVPSKILSPELRGLMERLYQILRSIVRRCYFLARCDILVTNVILNSRGMWISTERGELFGIRGLEIANFPRKYEVLDYIF